jgi:hypothetical protein
LESLLDVVGIKVNNHTTTKRVAIGSGTAKQTVQLIRHLLLFQTLP